VHTILADDVCTLNLRGLEDMAYLHCMHSCLMSWWWSVQVSTLVTYCVLHKHISVTLHW